MTSPILILGLDGASWNQFHLGLDSSKLPTIAKIREEGIEAISESHLPPVTCPNWRCMSSGKTPGQLGVYWWEHIDIEAGKIDLADSDDFFTSDIWDYLADGGKNIGVVNMPLTYPPDESIHPFISGGPDCEQSGYASTPELERVLESKFDYRVHSRTAPTDPPDRVTDDVLELIDLRFEVSKFLYHEYDLDFLFTVIYYLVRLEHYYWNSVHVQSALELIDDHLSWFLEEGFNIILASDHGCKEIDTIFNINEWLRTNGYLSLSESDLKIHRRLASAGINTENLASALGRLGIRQHVSRLVPNPIAESLPDSPSGKSGTDKAALVNWSRTTAIASGQGPIYARDDVDLDRLAASLEAYAGPGDQPVVDAVHLTEKLYPEAADDDDAPALILEQRPGVHTTDALGTGNVTQTASDRAKWKAENHRDGLLAAAGPDITDDWNQERTSISDIAPTILYLLGQAVPSDMAGEVLPILDSEMEIQYRDPIVPKQSNEMTDDRAMYNRLQDLGYLE